MLIVREMKKTGERHLSGTERSLVKAIESDLENLLVTIDHFDEDSGGVKLQRGCSDPCNSIVNGQSKPKIIEANYLVQSNQSNQ